jgi:hypothetical protein
MENKRDNVKHPSHYAEGRKFEPKDVIRDWGLNFNLGSAVKYISRAGRKDDVVQDLKKAQEFIQFEIDAIEAERANAVKLKAPQHINCKCSVKPKVEVIEMQVPKGATREQIIKKIIDDMFGSEE